MPAGTVAPTWQPEHDATRADGRQRSRPATAQSSRGNSGLEDARPNRQGTITIARDCSTAMTLRQSRAVLSRALPRTVGAVCDMKIPSILFAVLAVLAVLIGGTSVASANTLVIEPTSSNLVPLTFDYRFDATRRWLGCYQYDVLQGSGWYASAWYHTATLTQVDGDYEARFQRTWQERYCAADMGPYNYVNFVWTSPSDSTLQYRGVMQIHAGASASVDEVTCRLIDPTSPYNAIECDAAEVSFAGPRTTIIVHLDGLD